ncbi:hypothetical protein DESUT3_15620 [Desulfuromonas versatilis]|uniref:LysM domain-containing protein n=1 Tax=Desulfuromonas versatilis TaxID=2802975 RepID=A0ABM8HRE5_9BACT|nr:LysM peptidoglycan-binding domain-containing protein [Desulfuromonas versatilis]BCR04493.1 hypothetical protein DESUT3_15620 [Desulfuromonas versatilis]
MKKIGALALISFLGGCALPPPQLRLPNAAAVVQEAPLQAGTLSGAPAAAGEPQGEPADWSVAGFDGQFPDPTLQGEVDPAGEAFDEAGSEDQEASMVDPETLEDNLLLSGQDEAPPEDEGTTVIPHELSFDFPVVENQKVRYFVDFYTGKARKTFTRWLERSGRYIPLMRQIFAEEGLPEDLAYLAMVESGFNNKAYSWAHAVGPWQFIESTGRGYGLNGNWWLDERRDFEKSTRAAARFLNDLYQRFDGEWYLAVAAYNAGGGKISQAVNRYGSTDFWEISRGDFLQQETKHYVPKLLAVLLIAQDPEKYGFDNLQYHEPLDFEVVEVPTTTDLEIIASSSGASYEEIKQLNPELKRWSTPPGVKNYPVRIPAGTGEDFAANFANVPANRRANYKQHTIGKGDTLLALAKRYNIRVEDIISMNRIDNPRSLRIGTNLVLPLHASFSRLPVDEMKDDYVRSRRRTYTVRKGDSLWSIARRFDVGEKELRVWNRLGWSNVIRPGQTIVVSAKAVKGSSATAGKGSPARGQKVVHKVSPGDNLWDISRKYNVTTREILAWNNLKSSKVLRPGDKLTIFVAAAEHHASAGKKSRSSGRKIVYKVRPGDNLWSISRKYSLATREIMSWNNLGEDHVLRPGDELTLHVTDEG